MIENISWGDCSESRYLKQDDIPADGMTVTIKGFSKDLIEGRNGDDDKSKVVVHFDELGKPLVLNQTNGALMKALTGAANPAESVGKRLDIFVDPTISFGGKIVGGIRFRAPSIPF